VCSLRDAATELADLEVVVYALSLDGVAELAAFAKAQELPFQLLSDPDGSAAAKYGVLVPERGFARRVTFVVDEQGVVRHVDDLVKVASHGADLAELVRQLRN
jgi:peroxiredoxin Q/BCP